MDVDEKEGLLLGNHLDTMATTSTDIDLPKSLPFVAQTATPVPINEPPLSNNLHNEDAPAAQSLVMPGEPVSTLDNTGTLKPALEACSTQAVSSNKDPATAGNETNTNTINLSLPPPVPGNNLAATQSTEKPADTFT
ncbi:hypothetical protein V5O48_017322, partial [Marasmius crinis-equi]